MTVPPPPVALVATTVPPLQLDLLQGIALTWKYFTLQSLAGGEVWLDLACSESWNTSCSVCAGVCSPDQETGSDNKLSPSVWTRVSREEEILKYELNKKIEKFVPGDGPGGSSSDYLGLEKYFKLNSQILEVSGTNQPALKQTRSRNGDLYLVYLFLRSKEDDLCWFCCWMQEVRECCILTTRCWDVIQRSSRATVVQLSQISSLWKLWKMIQTDWSSI